MTPDQTQGRRLIALLKNKRYPDKGRWYYVCRVVTKKPCSQWLERVEQKLEPRAVRIDPRY